MYKHFSEYIHVHILYIHPGLTAWSKKFSEFRVNKPKPSSLLPSSDLELELDEHAVLSAREHRPLLPAGQRQRIHVVAAAQLARAHLLARNLDRGC